MSGSKIIDGLKDAVAGNFSRVVIDGQTWVRQGAPAVRASTPEDHDCIFRDAYLEISRIVGRQGSEDCSLADQVRAHLRSSPVNAGDSK